MMSHPAAAPRLSRPARANGYLGSALVNGVLLFLINIEPGWRAVPFLTEDLTRVLGLINASLIAAIVTGLVCTILPSARLNAVGTAVGGGIGVAAMIQLWMVFPFEVTSAWTVVFRVVLILGITGGTIGVLVSVFTALTGRPGRS